MPTELGQFVNVSSQFKGKAIVTLGASAAQQVVGKPVKITRIRGVISDVKDYPQPLIGLMAPGQVLRQPHHELSFRADYEMLRQLKDADYDATNLKFDVGQDYRWLNNKAAEAYVHQCINEREDPTLPLPCAMDTETVGGKWYEGAVPIMAQLSFKIGDGIAIPLEENLCARIMAGKRKTKDGGPVIEYDDNDPLRVENLIIHDLRQWKECLALAKKIVPKNSAFFKRLMEEEIHPLVFTGQNFKYDIHVCMNVGIEINPESWEHDTMQLAFVMDENIQSKDLASVTKIWCPPLSAYYTTLQR